MTDAEWKAFLAAFKTNGTEQYEIPVEGSLGLLALGDLGLIAWRYRRQQESLKSPKK